MLDSGIICNHLRLLNSNSIAHCLKTHHRLQWRWIDFKSFQVYNGSLKLQSLQQLNFHQFVKYGLQSSWTPDSYFTRSAVMVQSHPDKSNIECDATAQESFMHERSALASSEKFYFRKFGKPSQLFSERSSNSNRNSRFHSGICGIGTQLYVNSGICVPRTKCKWVKCE